MDTVIYQAGNDSLEHGDTIDHELVRMKVEWEGSDDQKRESTV